MPFRFLANSTSALVIAVWQLLRNFLERNFGCSKNFRQSVYHHLFSTGPGARHEIEFGNERAKTLASLPHCGASRVPDHPGQLKRHPPRRVADPFARHRLTMVPSGTGGHRRSSASPPHHPSPRFRALALFGRRPPERAVRSSLPASVYGAYRCQVESDDAVESFCQHQRIAFAAWVALRSVALSSQAPKPLAARRRRGACRRMRSPSHHNCCRDVTNVIPVLFDRRFYSG
jgi:hypothetical protein